MVPGARFWSEALSKRDHRTASRKGCACVSPSCQLWAFRGVQVALTELQHLCYTTQSARPLVVVAVRLRWQGCRFERNEPAQFGGGINRATPI